MSGYSFSFIAARVDKDGKHNDRNFDLSLAPHINPEDSIGNQFYTYNGNTELTLRDNELQFYRDNFTSHIANQNQRNIEARHPERNLTIEQYYKNYRTRPEDIIMQIGDKDGFPPAEKLWECALAYKDEFNKRFGDSCVILDMSLHVDEVYNAKGEKKGTPHVHIRRVWLTEGRDGKEASQTKALADLGYYAPHPQQKITKRNNPKMPFSVDDRALAYKICQEKEIDLRPERFPGTYKSVPVNEYKAKKEAEKLNGLKEQMEKVANVCDEFLTTSLYINGRRDKEVIDARKLELAERLERLQAIIDAEMAQELANNSSPLLASQEAESKKKVRELEAELKKQRDFLQAFLKKYSLEETYEREQQVQREERAEVL